MSVLTIRKVGEWGRAERVLTGLITTYPQVSAIMLAEAHDAKKRLVRKIERQEYDWPPASPNSRQIDPRLMIETGQYLRSIRVVPMGIGLWGIGVSKSAVNDKGIRLADLGLWHEYGAGNLPPRPHWRPESSVLKRQLSRKLGALLAMKVSLR